MRRSTRLAGTLALLCSLLFPSAAIPVLYIDINAPGGKRMPIAVANFVVASGDPALSRAVPKVLEGDPALTDLFDLVAERKGPHGVGHAGALLRHPPVLPRLESDRRGGGPRSSSSSRASPSAGSSSA